MAASDIDWNEFFESLNGRRAPPINENDMTVPNLADFSLIFLRQNRTRSFFARRSRLVANLPLQVPNIE